MQWEQPSCLGLPGALTPRRPTEQPSGDSVGPIFESQGAHVSEEEGCPPRAAVHPWDCCQAPGPLSLTGSATEAPGGRRSGTSLGRARGHCVACTP